MEKRVVESVLSLAFITQKSHMENEVLMIINGEISVDAKRFFIEEGYMFEFMPYGVFTKDHTRDVSILYEDISELDIKVK